jgi:gamma-glutamyltranspeptidase/glutathione hydrolase
MAATAPSVEGTQGMVVTSQALASKIGLDILRQGGNAIDAAVAIGYAEAVTNPCCGNIGGGGFMTIHLASGQNIFINFREKAPLVAHPNLYLDREGSLIKNSSLYGYLAAAIPGTVMGLDKALTGYGTLSREKVMNPAIRLARDGFVLTRGDTDILEAGASHLSQDPIASKIFFHKDGTVLSPGEKLIQLDLAQTLSLIAQFGPSVFYEGSIAEKIIGASQSHGGLFTQEDFSSYKISESEPLTCFYRGYEILTAKPPSSGGVTLCETLKILEGYKVKDSGFHSAASIHLLVEALRYAYHDRNLYLGDPDFVQNPVDQLLSNAYIDFIRQHLDPLKASPVYSSDIQGLSPEKNETTHYSVLDKSGNAVSVTYTINGLFGANVIPPDTGILLNDEMDDFAVKPNSPNLYGLIQGKANQIESGKRPLSSMAPTIVMKNGKVVMVLGSPGGSRIITIVLQVIMNMIDYGMSPSEAVSAPRIHYQAMPDEIYTEPYGLSADTIQLLQGMGHKIVEQTPWGAAEVIVVAEPQLQSQKTSSGNDAMVSGKMRPGLIYGENDPRRPAGMAIGY